MKLEIVRHQIQFKKPAKTSRNVFETRDIRYIVTKNEKGYKGIGEASPLKLLSIDDRPDYDEYLESVVNLINKGTDWREMMSEEWPSIRFAMETAMLDLQNGGKRILFDTPFSRSEAGIPINGLIWMDEIDAMRSSVDDKVREGYDVIKLKIGAHDFDAECRMLEDIRKHYTEGKITLRLDANGAFEIDDALLKLKELSRFGIHSIEQPIKQGNIDAMAKLCHDSKIDIALDEELIGVSADQADALLRAISPQYIILKPNLIGGLEASDKWIRAADKREIQWWATSALETNIGLNAIAQWASTYNNKLPQGLGTGSLYTNNIESPLVIEKERLFYGSELRWKFFN